MDDMGIRKKQTYGIYLKKVDVCKKFTVSNIGLFFLDNLSNRRFFLICYLCRIYILTRPGGTYVTISNVF